MTSIDLRMDHQRLSEVEPAARCQSRDWFEKRIRPSWGCCVSDLSLSHFDFCTYTAQWCIPQAKMALARVLLGREES
jgi:hypothetical protein